MYVVVRQDFVRYVQARYWLCNKAPHEVTGDIAILAGAGRQLADYRVLVINRVGQVIEFCRADRWVQPDLRNGDVVTESGVVVDG